MNNSPHGLPLQEWMVAVAKILSRHQKVYEMTFVTLLELLTQQGHQLLNNAWLQSSSTPVPWCEMSRIMQPMYDHACLADIPSGRTCEVADIIYLYLLLLQHGSKKESNSQTSRPST
jgi:hypothetical protein